MMPASAVAPASWSSVYTISAWSTNGAESPSSWASAGSKPYRQLTPRVRSTASTRGKSLSAIAFASATVASGLPYSARSAAAGSLISAPSWATRSCSTANGMRTYRAVLHHFRVHRDLVGGFDQRRQDGNLVRQRMPVPQVLDDQHIDEVGAERLKCRCPAAGPAQRGDRGDHLARGLEHGGDPGERGLRGRGELLDVIGQADDRVKRGSEAVAAGGLRVGADLGQEPLQGLRLGDRVAERVDRLADFRDEGVEEIRAHGPSFAARLSGYCGSFGSRLTE